MKSGFFPRDGNDLSVESMSNSFPPPASHVFFSGNNEMGFLAKDLDEVSAIVKEGDPS